MRLMAVNNESTWRELAVKAQGGDQAAYRTLLSSLSPFVKRVIIKTLPTPDAADDIVQEVLLSVHKALRTYAPDRPFVPWLMAIVNFRRTDYLRTHYAQNHHMKADIESLEWMEEGSSPADTADTIKDVQDALNTLSPQQKNIFQLVKVDGYSMEETAQKTGMTAGAVKVSVHRTIQKLREKLQ
jgi:RNA polymerase sigma factor (sigma-70 family)